MAASGRLDAYMATEAFNGERSKSKKEAAWPFTVTGVMQHHFYHSLLIRIRQPSFQGKASFLDGRMTKDLWTCFKTVTRRLGEKEM